MTEATNGAGDPAAAELMPTPEEIEAAEQSAIMPRPITVEEYVAIALTAAVTGVIVRQQHVPARTVMKIACGALGTLVGMSFQGTLPEIFAIREECRKAFVSAIRNVPPPPPPPPAGDVATRIPNGG